MIIVVQILKEIAKAIMVSLVTRKFLEELLIYILEKLAKKTDNNVDDEVVEMVKRALNKPEESEQENK